MIKIAITGGIGSGKTQVSDHLRSLGYTVIDADAISREMTAPGGKSLPLIRERFGDTLFDEDGKLDRAAVREMIFRDPDKKALYEECTTQLVISEIAEITASCEKAGEKALFYDIPLLFETGSEKYYDAVWVVTADPEIRKERIRARDNKDNETIELIMNSQTSDAEKTAKADKVIKNNGSLEELNEAVDRAVDEFVR